MSESGHLRLHEKPCYDTYEQRVNQGMIDRVLAFAGQEQEVDVGYRIQVSAVFSSNIEGNTLDVNTYMNLKMRKETLFKKKEVTEIDDLIAAYHFAKEHVLNEQNFLTAHAILSKHILIKSKQGKYRKESIGVFSESGLVYVAVENQFVIEHMRLFFTDIESLLHSSTSIKETLYFASLIHLRFVHIHPFADGNGRAARLLEKWFLTSKLGEQYWHVLSEKYYKEHQGDYYRSINLGVNFYELDYSQCLPFLLMLPESFAG